MVNITDAIKHAVCSQADILARLDLTCAQRAVQSCHALAALMLRSGADP